MAKNEIPKQGDVVIFLGADDDQVNWKSCDDPRKVLKQGVAYIVERSHIGHSYSEIEISGIPGSFNSVCFKTGKDAKILFQTQWAAENNIELVPEADGFKVGDPVIFTNDQGVVFYDLFVKAIRKEPTPWGARFYIFDDAYWYPTSEKNIKKIE